jgi:Ca2+-binding EF-hand superfamily protein
MSISGVGGGASAFMRPLQPPSFSSIDSNSSGDITLDELKANAPGGASDTKSAERAEKLFAAMDADSNGSVTSDEKDAFDTKLQEQRQQMQFMTQLMAGGGMPPAPPSNEDIFAATDADSSGSVSLEEFSASDAAADMSTDELSELFSTIDADGDGSITETESSDFLDTLKSAMGGGERPMSPPPPGGPGSPGGPGGPPPGAESETEESEDDTDTLALDLLTAAKSAYSSRSSSDDLLATLTKIFDEAA